MSRQSYSFGFTDALLAELGGVSLARLHRDADAICRCCDAAEPLAVLFAPPLTEE